MLSTYEPATIKLLCVERSLRTQSFVRNRLPQNFATIINILESLAIIIEKLAMCMRQM